MTERIYRFISCTVLATFLGGCATTQQYNQVMDSASFKQSPDLSSTSGNAKIYVMRRSAFAGSAVAIGITDTGRSVGKIGSGGLLVWERPAGQIIVGASASNEGNLSFAVAPGDVVFIETRTNWGAGLNSAACEIRLLSNAEGRALLAEIQSR